MNAQDSYLDEVRRRLDGLSRERREIVLDDLRGHLEDAAAAGRSADETLVALGTPAEIAERAYEEFGRTPGAPDAADRAWRALQWTAVAVGVLIAVVVAFILPSYASATTSSDGSDLEMVTTQTLFQAFGLGTALVCLIPALIAAVPLAMPKRARLVVSLVTTSLLSLFCLVSGFTIGGFFLPVAMLGWAAIITSWQLRTRGGFGRGWWIAGAVVAAVPTIVAIGGLLSGTSALGIAAWILIAIDIALAVLLALGMRAAGWAAAGFGALMTVAVLFSPDPLFIVAVIWIGGLLMAVGLSHALGARQE